MARSFRIIPGITRRTCLFSTALLILIPCGCAQFSGGKTSLVAQNSVEGSHTPRPVLEPEFVTLAGNTHPLARTEFDRGTISPEIRLERMMLLLRPGTVQQAELDTLVEAQQEPRSPLYHQWLTPEQYGSRFGAPSADLALVTQWLTDHGFTVEPLSAGRRLIVFSGTSGQVAETFHSQIHRYEVNGQAHIANSEDPQIPKALAPVVAGIVSLHDFRRISATQSVLKVVRMEPGLGKTIPENTQGSDHYLFPADFATIYDLNPQYAEGNYGAGVSIAIMGRSNINQSDVSRFRSYAGLGANAPTVILDGANPGLVEGDQGEATLDVEWVGGVAPAAAVKYVAAASTATSDGVDLAAQYAVNHKTASIISTSFGNCEADMGTAELAFYYSLWQQAASEGISVFVSSGDSGAAGCDAAASSRGAEAAVNGLCSSPYSSCVGGTEFNEGSTPAKYWGPTNGNGGGSALGYIREEAWNESGSDGGSGLWASGGGVSRIYSQPSWQIGISGANSNGMRAVPDVALTAAAHDGYLVSLNGSWYVFSGTSAASPSFAGIMSLVVQNRGGQAQGNVNPTLYGLLDANANPFHATPSGNNSVPGVNGFAASGAAYNLATGLGSVDADLLANQWPTPGGVIAPQGFALRTSTASVSLSAGKAATFTVSATSSGGFSGPVNLSATAPSGVAISFSPSSIKPGASATATLMVNSGAALGKTNITIRGTSGSLAATATVGLTVQVAPTLEISANSSKLAVPVGKTTTLLVTTTTGGSFSGAVNLTVTGMPAGVTATWSTGGFAPNGTSTTISTLTLKATGDAPINSATLRITASGDGLQAQAQCTVQVTSNATIALSLSSADIAMKSNATQQMVLTVTPEGGALLASTAAGTSFQVNGLPIGVRASWSVPQLTGKGAVVATLTLLGSGIAGSSISTLTITARLVDAATGAVYAASQQATLTVTNSSSLPPQPIRRR